ncbi:MAG: hypothetical protein QNJ73_00145 [Gammaproteobacteria bacterium]|nr:hypothetical protein [Gammaproteobacteria bacterium]
MPRDRSYFPATFILVGCMAIGAVASGAYAEANLENGELKAKGCLNCHAEDAFAASEADALAADISAILAGEKPHMPISQKLSEQDVADIAAYLVSAGSAPDADTPANLANGERRGRSCLGCHAIDNFATYKADGLAAYIRAILAGETGHMRIPATLSDEDITDVAAWLVAENSAPGG